MNRRDFIGLGMGLVSLELMGCSGEPAMNVAATPSGFNYRVGPWTGDNPVPMHRIRDALTGPLPNPERSLDLVIVGGGLSGLALGYLCRSQDLVILEREDRAGGNAKSGTFQGVEYSQGAAYLVDIEPPFGPLYADLGLELKSVPRPSDLMWTPSGFADLEAGPLAQVTKALRAEMSTLLKSPDYPCLPIQKASSRALKLDQLSCADWLKPRFQEFLPQADAYCWSSLGGASRDISAYVGLSGLSELALEIYAFPGGNARVAQRLVKKLGPERLLTGQSVYRVEPHGSKVRVGFFDSHSDTPQWRCFEARKVALACPYLMAGRLIPWADSRAIRSMLSLQYGAYLVANLCFEGRLDLPGYDHWCHDSSAWTDFIPSASANHQVLTVYAPFKEPAEGRGQLLRSGPQPLARRIVEDLQRRLKFEPSSLREVHLTRYGHQILTSRPGIVSQMLALPRQYGNVWLCHSDGQGCASIESALCEALALASRWQRKT